MSESGLVQSKCRRWWARASTIRALPSQLEGWGFGALAILLSLLVWYILTIDWPKGRIVDRYTLPSPKEAFATFPELWNRGLSRSILWSIGRVLGGFVFAALIAIPLGVIAGSYPRIHAFLKPLGLFGRNIPIAALIPLTLIWFGLGELQKIMFIFLASVAFLLFDTSNAVQSVPDRYLDTAYTLGAKRTPARGARISGIWAAVYALVFALGWWLLKESRPSLGAELASLAFWKRALIGASCGFALWYPIHGHQVLGKVLLPLAMPDIATSLRLLFGLAFGYIMLAEAIDAGRGLGFIIIQSQRQGPREHIYLCLIIISIVAWLIDRAMLWTHRQLFPYIKNAES